MVEKLGIKESFKMAILNPPDNYDGTLGELPKDATIMRLKGNLDLIQLFTTRKKELEVRFPELKRELSQKRILRICWPKKLIKSRD